MLFSFGCSGGASPADDMFHGLKSLPPGRPRTAGPPDVVGKHDNAVSRPFSTKLRNVVAAAESVATATASHKAAAAAVYDTDPATNPLSVARPTPLW